MHLHFGKLNLNHVTKTLLFIGFELYRDAFVFYLDELILLL